MASTKDDVLRDLTFGARIAEDERDALAGYFVETDQWRRVLAGEIDVIYGAKGSGKSAIYTSLLNRESEFFDDGILLVSAENPQGTTVFKDLLVDPPATEPEFTVLWKLYILSLLGALFQRYDFMSPQATEVLDALGKEKLLQPDSITLSTRFKTVVDWVKRTFRRVSEVSGEVKFEPVTGVPIGIGGTIALSEPTVEQRAGGGASVDQLLALAAEALELEDFTAWILFDRLDVAFAQSRDLEANALRALFKAYLDMGNLSRIALKIFLRTDIWKAITASGFREASHITRELTIQWSDRALLRLIVSRALNSAHLASFYDVAPVDVLADAGRQREFFDRMVPDKIDVGNNPMTFEWILGRVKDGTGNSAPREMIHLLNATREAQVQMIEEGQPAPAGEVLLGRAAFRAALPAVSQTRLSQTIYAEYPTEAIWIRKLEGEKTAQSVESLARIWAVDKDQAMQVAQQLVEIGFFDQARLRSRGDYWVPHLYRTGLSLVQGSADGAGDSNSSNDTAA